MRRSIIALFMALFSGLPAVSQAVFIVNTGEPPGPVVGGPGVTGLLVFGNGTASSPSFPYAYQYVAAEFSISESYSLNSVRGFIETSSLQSFGTLTGTMTAAIYADAGEVPGLELYSAAFTIGTPLGAYVPAWQGATGLDWLLSAGTYWVAFEVRPGQAANAVMRSGAPSPLGNEAFATPLNPGGAYLPYDSMDLGYQIEGTLVPTTPSSVPETGTAALIVSALGILIAVRRKAHSSAAQ
jgi:hypothetical protein